MRPDMHQVLIESPRRGAGFKTRRNNKPRVREWDGEDGYGRDYRPSRLRTKYFDDHLRPVERWLRKQVGRPWDKVWSELCAGIDTRSVIGQHLMGHAREFVAIHCRLDADGAVVALGRTRFRRRHVDGWARVEGLYVHPRTGLLRWREPIRRERSRLPSPLEPADTFRLGETLFRIKREGVWYRAHVETLPRYTGKQQPAHDFVWHHQRIRILVKRQLTTRELRDLGLANDAPD